MKFAALLLVVLTSSEPASAQNGYTVTDLGILPGGTQSIGSGINSRGQVTGYADAAGVNYAFLYSAGVMTKPWVASRGDWREQRLEHKRQRAGDRKCIHRQRAVPCLCL
jgi:probable HAF family extracellular repeat protein